MKDRAYILSVKGRCQTISWEATSRKKIRKETTIKELNRLCELGVMEFQPTSEWASPSFIIPKSDQTVRMISDFKEVNKQLVRKPSPYPKSAKSCKS